MDLKEIIKRRREKFGDDLKAIKGKKKGLPTPEIPSDLFLVCPKCKKSIYKKDVREAHGVCPSCGHLYRLSAVARVKYIADEDTWEAFDFKIARNNPLDFPNYEDKLQQNAEKSGMHEAVLCGRAKIDGTKCILCVMDSHFMMGSMGYYVGEALTRSIEKATKEKLPIVIFTCSGGARMQEGMVSLMQMAKVSGAISKHAAAGLLYVTVLTDPTTGGVTASFASLGDIILAEKGALIGFAGRRVIEQTMRQKLPADFQTAEFLLEKGFVDMIVDRSNIKKVIGKILEMHG